MEWFDIAREHAEHLPSRKDYKISVNSTKGDDGIFRPMWLIKYRYQIAPIGNSWCVIFGSDNEKDLAEFIAALNKNKLIK